MSTNLYSARNTRFKPDFTKTGRNTKIIEEINDDKKYKKSLNSINLVPFRAPLFQN